MAYYDNYLVDNHSCVIVGVQATAARMSQETVAAQAMIARFAHWQGREPVSVAADTTYGNGEFLQWLLERDITPYMRTRDSIHRKTARFMARSGLSINRNATAISAPQVSRSTMVAATCGTAPLPISGRASAAEHARKKHNAPREQETHNTAKPA